MAAKPRAATKAATKPKAPAKPRRPAARKPDAPPAGLEVAWRALWIRCRDQLRRQGTWLDTDTPQLDRYIGCLRAAEVARTEAETTPFVEGSKEQLVAHPGFRLAEQCEAAALKYATALLLTAQTRARHKLGGERAAEDPMDEVLDA